MNLNSHVQTEAVHRINYIYLIIMMMNYVFLYFHNYITDNDSSAEPSKSIFNVSLAAGLMIY